MHFLFDVSFGSAYNTPRGMMVRANGLTINDPAFAWLRGVSALIVQIDERMEDKKAPLTSTDAKNLRAEVRDLLTPSQTGNDFQRNYYWALQETPDIVVEHSGMIKHLSK